MQIGYCRIKNNRTCTTIVLGITQNKKCREFDIGLRKYFVSEFDDF